MKSKLLIPGLLICLLSISSCGSSSEREYVECPVIDVDADFNSSTDNASSFFDDYGYVVLEPNDTIPIGNIDIIDFDHDNIAVASKNTIYLYDRNGHEKTCFNKTGQGPEEYLKIQDMCIGENGIYVLCRMSKRILVYDLQGNCVSVYQLQDNYGAFVLMKDYSWLASESCNSSGFEFSLYDMKSKEINEKLMPFEERQSFIPPIEYFDPFLYVSEDEVLTAREFDYSVYKISKENKISKEWEYRFNTKKQIPDFGDDLSYVELYDKLSHEPVVMWLGTLWKGEEHVYQSFKLTYKIGLFTNIYKFSLQNQEKKGELLHLGLKSYDGFPFLIGQMLTIRDGCLISTIPLFHAKDIAEKEGIEALKGYEIDDPETPVIIFHHFKD